MILDGKSIAQHILSSLESTVQNISGRKPTLAFVLVGENPASQAYIRMKKKRCEEVGINSEDLVFPKDLSQKALLLKIHQLNMDPKVDGILVQLPLPEQIDTHTIISAIDPEKDVDGFHPINVGKVLLGEEDGFVPCTPLGIVTLLEESNIDPSGKHVVILGRSNIVGKPLAALLMQKKPHANATVTIAHSRSSDLPKICQSADILIAAIGSPKFVTKKMVKEGTVVVDVGINRIEGKIIGDVDYDEIAPLSSAITPVPGGVGPMTIAMLLSNTVKSYHKRQAP